MSNLRYLTNRLRIVTRSIRRHVTTADTNREGYLKTDGTNRTLCTAIDTDGFSIIVYAETNGDPVVLCEGDEIPFAQCVGDNFGTDSGLARLIALSDEIRDEDRAAADWLDERIRAITATTDDE